MDHIFRQSFIPNAHIFDCPLDTGFRCYINGDVVFVLANADNTGAISKEIKEKIFKMLKPYDKQLVLVSMYSKREKFIEVEKVAWGSYVWFADAPTHTIYFEDNPSSIEPYSRNKKI